MFKINAEELKREIQKKMARLKKINKELQKMAPVENRKEKEIKKWQRRWGANSLAGYTEYNDEDPIGININMIEHENITDILNLEHDLGNI